MLLPMLKAVKKMLGTPTSPDSVNCAVIVLEEIISSLEGTPIPENPKPVSNEKNQAATPQLQSRATPKPKPEVEVPPAGKEWFVTVSDKGDLYIQDFPEDGLVEVDGKKMKYSESRGLKFKKARIL